MTEENVLIEALQEAHAFLTHADFDFRNGNTAPSGVDEGEYYGTKALVETVSQVEAALEGKGALTPAWEVVQNIKLAINSAQIWGPTGEDACDYQAAGDLVNVINGLIDAYENPSNEKEDDEELRWAAMDGLEYQHKIREDWDEATEDPLAQDDVFYQDEGSAWNPPDLEG
jgi:hypothetical protein